MRYWYTVIFIVLGVFSLMAIIIKICGKKTPLVHSRRKRRRQTIQHGAEYSRNSDNPTDIQVKYNPYRQVSRDYHRRNHWIFESFEFRRLLFLMNSGDCFSLYESLANQHRFWIHIYKSSYLFKKFAPTMIRTRATISRPRC